MHCPPETYALEVGLAVVLSVLAVFSIVRGVLQNKEDLEWQLGEAVILGIFHGSIMALLICSGVLA